MVHSKLSHFKKLSFYTTTRNIIIPTYSRANNTLSFLGNGKRFFLSMHSILAMPIMFFQFQFFNLTVTNDHRYSLAIFTFCTVNTRGPYCNSGPHAVKPGGRRRPFWIQNPNALEHKQCAWSSITKNKIPFTQSAHFPPDNMAITVLVITAAATGTFKPASTTVLKRQSGTATSNGKLLGIFKEEPDHFQRM